MRPYRLSLLLAAMLLALAAVAQRVVTVEGYAKIYAPDDMSPKEARARVVEQARHEAVGTQFGTNVVRSNFTTVSNDERGSNVASYMFGASDLRGRWVRDLERPRVAVSVIEGRHVYEAWVKGEAQAIERAPVTFEWKLLRGTPDDRSQVSSEQAELLDGDEFFLRFRSPVKGYLLAFQADDQGIVYKMLPNGDDFCRIERGQWYTFDTPQEGYFATLSEGRRMEYDQLYLVFSPSELYPPVAEVPAGAAEQLQRYGAVAPVEQLSFDAFQKYLGKILRDPKVQVEKRFVKIVRRD